MKLFTLVLVFSSAVSDIYGTIDIINPSKEESMAAMVNTCRGK
jgi:hypothetical protein